MSFLHSEQPKCNKILPPFRSRKCHFATFSPCPTVSLRTQRAPCFTAPSRVKCPPFLPGGGPFLSHSVYWKSLLGLAWLSYEGLDLGLATASRAECLAPVSSGLRTDQKRFALIFPFHSHVWQLISQYQEPLDVFQIWKLPLEAPPLHSQFLLLLLIPGWKRSGSALGWKGFLSGSLYLPTPCPPLCIFI